MAKMLFMFWYLVVISFLSSIYGAQPIFNYRVADCFIANKGTTNIFNCGSLVNDPVFMQQWYIVSKPEHRFWNHVTVDLGILEVWINYGLFGEGIVVVDYDDGMETSHPDLKSNYNPKYGWDYCTQPESSNSDPKHPTDTHGTMAAGVIAMEINNGICGVGVAPLATLGAVRSNAWYCNAAYYGPGRTTLFAKAMKRNMEDIHVAIHGYLGSRANPRSNIPEYSETFEDDLMETIIKGRGGKGIIHVFSSGNDKFYGFGCSFHIYANNPYSIIVSASKPWGDVSEYSSRCPGIRVSAPSSIIHPQFFYSSAINGGCTDKFGGTSGAAPLAGAIFALTLNANTSLTWRDFHHLLPISSTRDRANVTSFIRNGAGFYVSHDYGFGLINAVNLVAAALNFESVPRMRTCSVTMKLNKRRFITPERFSESINTSACKGTSNEVNYLEHVQVKIQMSYNAWCYLQIDLISPERTKAHILEVEPANWYTGAVTLVVDSVITWGESPRGRWTIEMFDNFGHEDPANVYSGNITSITLKFFGTKEKPSHYD